MAAATSSPELFINSVGTFITESDLGVGTVVGSAVFNILTVPACCGLFAAQVSFFFIEEDCFLIFQFQIIDLDWWPISRDCLMYGISVISLIAVLQDGRVEWWEAVNLVLGYLIYILGIS